MRFFLHLQGWLCLLTFSVFNLQYSYAQDGFSAGRLIPTPDIDNLIQGRLYVPDYISVQGSAFFLESWLAGNVHYQENIYRDLPLRYDIYKDKVIFLSRTDEGWYNVVLSNGYIREFTLDNLRFINIQYSIYQDSTLAKGFYEVIHEAPLTILAKRKLEMDTRESLKYFRRNDQWFLFYQGKAYRVRKKKGILKAIGKEYKRPLSSFLNERNILIRQADRPEWQSIGQFLNNLLQTR